jgi:hypothetical protein
MDRYETSVPERRNMPLLAAVILAALIGLGVVFVWPW